MTPKGDDKVRRSSSRSRSSSRRSSSSRRLSASRRQSSPSLAVFPSENSMKSSQRPSPSRERYYRFHEEEGDLFTAPLTFSLAHCVSSDMKMSAGIAVRFKSKFGQVETLLNQGRRVGEVAVLQDGPRYIFYLVTKNRYFDKPTESSLQKSLLEMKDLCLKLSVKKLAMPRIGCGLDGLEWASVSTIICQVFAGSGIALTVYSLGSRTPSYKSSPYMHSSLSEPLLREEKFEKRRRSDSCDSRITPKRRRTENALPKMLFQHRISAKNYENKSPSTLKLSEKSVSQSSDDNLSNDDNCAQFLLNRTSNRDLDTKSKVPSKLLPQDKGILSLKDVSPNSWESDNESSPERKRRKKKSSIDSNPSPHDKQEVAEIYLKKSSVQSRVGTRSPDDQKIMTSTKRRHSDYLSPSASSYDEEEKDITSRDKRPHKMEIKKSAALSGRIGSVTLKSEVKDVQWTNSKTTFTKHRRGRDFLTRASSSEEEEEMHVTSNRVSSDKSSHERDIRKTSILSGRIGQVSSKSQTKDTSWIVKDLITPKLKRDTIPPSASSSEEEEMRNFTGSPTFSGRKVLEGHVQKSVSAANPANNVLRPGTRTPLTKHGLPSSPDASSGEEMEVESNSYADTISKPPTAGSSRVTQRIFIMDSSKSPSKKGLSSALKNRLGDVLIASKEKTSRKSLPASLKASGSVIKAKKLKSTGSMYCDREMFKPSVKDRLSLR